MIMETSKEFKELQQRLRELCPHINEVLIKDGMMTGQVYCEDCGRKRAWNAY